MKPFLPLLLAVVLVGCEYTVPLVANPEIALDPTVVGVWKREGQGGREERLLVLPLGETEYLVSFPAQAAEAMFARACLARVGEETLVQLRWLGTARGVLPEDGRVYQYATFWVTEGTLTVQMLNSAVVSKDIPSSEGLFRAIAAQMEHPDLFHDPMVFEKIEQ